MKIVIGIEEMTDKKDIPKLITAGADEFFCGIVPDEWADIYGYQISLNKREWKNSQFTNFNRLEDIVSEIHNYGKKIYAAFNAHSYTGDQLIYVEKYLRSLQEIGIDGLIVADIGLLVKIKDWNIDLDIHLSGESGVYNSSGAKFYEQFGIKRLIFPRDMTIGEMEDIVKNTCGNGWEYEAFIMSERCPFSAVYCKSSHGFSACNFCHQQWSKQIHIKLPYNFHDNATGNKISVAIETRPTMELLRKWDDNTWKYFGWASWGLRPSYQVKDHLLGHCGLCAVERLKKAGVEYIKVVCRGLNIKLKIARLSFLNHACRKDNFSTAECIKLKNQIEMCDLGYVCYYPEARKERTKND